MGYTIQVLMCMTLSSLENEKHAEIELLQLCSITMLKTKEIK